MSSEKFIKNKSVLITLISACLIVIISLGIRQTFGMFYFDFSVDLDITLSQFGFAIGLQMFLWGAFAPWFGVITDKYGGHIAVFIGFIFYCIVHCTLGQGTSVQIGSCHIQKSKEVQTPIDKCRSWT